MTSPRRLLDLTAEAASFSIHEFFRPLLALGRLLRAGTGRSQVAEFAREDQTSLEEAKAMLRERLAKSRRYERLLLTQCLISAFASVLGSAISLLHVFHLESAVALVAILVASFLAVWLAFRIVKNRETIIEVKTVYRLMNSLDRDTAERVTKQVIWGRSKTRRPSRKEKSSR